jgi:hypothetical protein
MIAKGVPGKKIGVRKKTKWVTTRNFLLNL